MLQSTSSNFLLKHSIHLQNMHQNTFSSGPSCINCAACGELIRTDLGDLWEWSPSLEQWRWVLTLGSRNRTGSAPTTQAGKKATLLNQRPLKYVNTLHSLKELLPFYMDKEKNQSFHLMYTEILCFVKKLILVKFSNCLLQQKSAQESSICLVLHTSMQRTDHQLYKLTLGEINLMNILIAYDHQPKLG